MVSGSRGLSVAGRSSGFVVRGFLWRGRRGVGCISILGSAFFHAAYSVVKVRVRGEKLIDGLIPVAA